MTGTTYFRIQTADRDVNDLLDPQCQYSHAWNGNPAYTRRGVSVCTSIGELAEYLASHIGAGIPVRSGDWVIVEVAGSVLTDEAPCDPEHETLIIPTEIISVRPADADFLAAMDAAEAFLASFDPTPEWED